LHGALQPQTALAVTRASTQTHQRALKMKTAFAELWRTFWQACKETPAGMLMPFKAFWDAATHNPILERRSKAGPRDGTHV
jgi:hypothetical protein